MPFLIRHTDGRTFELDDAAFYVKDYEPRGFVIVNPQPDGYHAPELPKAKPVKAVKDDGAAV